MRCIYFQLQSSLHIFTLIKRKQFVFIAFDEQNFPKHRERRRRETTRRRRIQLMIKVIDFEQHVNMRCSSFIPPLMMGSSSSLTTRSIHTDIYGTRITRDCLLFSQKGIVATLFRREQL